MTAACLQRRKQGLWHSCLRRPGARAWWIEGVEGRRHSRWRLCEVRVERDAEEREEGGLGRTVELYEAD